MVVEICDDGQKQTGLFKDIWEYIKEDTDDEDEQQLFDTLIELSTGTYEKPIYGGRVKIDGQTIDVDFVWEKSKVMLFLIENENAYKIASKSDWKCFCMCNEDIKAEQILKSIEVR